MSREDSLKMKENIESGKRRWLKAVKSLGGREWWRMREKVEWLVVIKGEGRLMTSTSR